MAKRVYKIDSNYIPSEEPKKKAFKVDPESPFIKDSISITQTGATMTPGLSLLEDINSDANNYLPGNAIGDAQLFLNQPTSEVIGNAMAGFGTQALAGIIDSVGAWDLKGISDMSVGKYEEDYGNQLNEWGKELRDFSEKEFPIYTAGDDMGSVEYWAKQGQSLGYSSGIILEMLAEQALLSTLGPEANAAGLMSKARLLKMAGQGAFGMFKGVQEGYMNGLETQQNVYQKYLNLGYNEDVAKQKANEAASLAFKLEVGPLAVLNGLQFMSTFGLMGKTNAFNRGQGINTGFSGAFESAGQRILGNAKNPYLNKALGFGIQTGSEGIEEGIQTLAGSFATQETLKSTKDQDFNFKYFNSELRDSMIGGALGGAMFSAGFKAFEKLTNGTAQRQFNNQYQSFINDAISRTSNSFESADKVRTDLVEATKSFKANPTEENRAKLAEATNRVKEAQYNSHLVNTVNALQLDYTKGDGSTVAFEAHVQQMQDVLDAVNKGDIDTLKSFGLVTPEGKEKFAGSFDNIKKTFPQNIQDSQSIKDKFENNLNYVTSDFESAFNITQKEYMNEVHLKDKAEVQNDMNFLYSNDSSFKQLTPAGQSRFKLETELNSINNLDRLNSVNIERKQELQEQLEDAPKYTSNDKLVIDAMNKVKYQNGYSSLLAYDQAIENNNKQLAQLRDQKNIEKGIKDRVKEKIEKATTKSEVVEVINTAKAEGVETPEIISKAEQKLESIKSQEVINQDEIKPQPENNRTIPEASVPLEDTNEQALSLASILDPSYQEDAPKDMGQEFFSRRALTEEVSETHPQYERAKTIGQSIAKRLDDNLGRTATLQDYIEDFISQTNYDEIEAKYNGLVQIWKAAGRDISSAEDVYINTFGKAAALELADLLVDPQDAALQTVTINKEAQQNEAQVLEFDLNGKPVLTDSISEDRRTNNPSNKAAFNFLDIQRIGNTEFTIVNTELKRDNVINNHFVLVPGYLKEGDELEVRVADIDTIPVTAYRTTGVEKMTWGQFKSLHGSRMTSELYNNKVPMVAYKGDTPLFYIHDVAWWNEQNVNDNVASEVKEEIINEGIENTKAIRNAVIVGNNKIKITNKSFGSIDSLVEHENKTLKTINEATGDSQLVVFKDGYFRKNNTSEPISIEITNRLDKKDQSGNSPYSDGQIYDVRLISHKDGKDQYIALPVITPSPVAVGNLEAEQLNEVAYNNIKFAILANAILNNTSNEILLTGIEAQYKIGLAHAQNIKQAIQRTTGIDISNRLDKYVELFTNTYNNGSNNLSIETIAKTSLTNSKGSDIYPIGKTYIKGFAPAPGKTGQITVFSKKKHYGTEEQVKGIQFGNVDRGKENAYFSNLDILLNEQTGVLKNVQMHVNTKALNSQDITPHNFVAISSQGQVSEMQGNYEYYLKQYLKTNVLSHKVQDETGRNVWITDVQPKINFELSSQIELAPTVKAKPESVIELAREAAQQVLEEGNKVDEELRNKALEALPEHLRSAYLNQQDQDINDEFEEFGSQRTISEEQQLGFDNLSSRQISTLNSEEQKQILSSLQHKIIASIDFIDEGSTLADIKEKIETSVTDYIVPSINNYKEIVSNLSQVPGLESEVSRFQTLVDKLQGIVNEQSKLTSFDPNNKGQLTRRFEQLFGGNLESLVEDEEGLQEDNYSNSFLEKDLKLSFSVALRLSLFGFEKLNTNNQKSYNFANIENYENADTVELALKEVTTNLDSNWDAFLNRLDSLAKDKGLPIYTQLKNKFKNAPEHIKNELLYKTISSKLTLYKVIYSYNESDKTYSLKVIDENSSKEEVKLPLQFKDNFIYKSPFGQSIESGERILNKEFAKTFSNKLDDLINKHKNGFILSTDNLREVKSILEDLGIEVDNNTIKAFVIQENPFKTVGLFGTASRYLKNFYNKTGNVVISDRSEETDFHAKISDGVKKLVNLQIELNGTYVAKSIRIDGKTMQGTIEKTMVYETVREIIPTEVNGELETSDLYNVLANAPYSKGNYVLDLLKSNAKFRKTFSVDFSSPQASKVHGKDMFGDRGFDKIPDTDNIITSLGLFTAKMGNVQIEANDFESSIAKGLKFRMGQMTFPALSDKGRMLYLRTALLDLKDKDVNIIDGRIGLSQDLSDFLVEHLFNHELRRIHTSYNNEPTNIVGYDKASKLFLGIPAFNEIKIDGVNIHTLLTSNVEGANVPYYTQDLDILIKKFKNSARDVLTRVIQSEVSSKVNQDGTGGEWVESGLYDSTEDEGSQIKYVDSKYVADKRSGTDLKTMHVITSDYVINNLLNQSNVYKLFLGDLAYFSKDKMIKSSREQYIDFNAMAQDNNYATLSENISVIVDKRAAMLIAPGKKLANSDVRGQDEYLQVFVRDVSSVSSVIKQLVEAQYGELSDRGKELFNLLEDNQKRLEEAYTENTDTSNILEERDAFVKELSGMYKELEKYFDIEGTDAQEYTTWKTHIDMLLRQGRLTREENAQLISAYEKMSQGNFNEVTQEEINTIMQPVKPVATGTVPVYNRSGILVSNRTIYIKSSSFPLIPQLTKGLELDKIREKLEQLEAKTNKMVRMSYQTANKIGSLNTKLSVQDFYNKDFADIYSVDENGNTKGILSESLTVLKTKNFKIQQETPSKTEKFVKKNSDNYVTMGSQIWKIILGNGINLNDSKAVFPNKFSAQLLKAVGVTPKSGMLTGADLDKIDFFVYNEYSTIQKESLYNDLNMDLNVPFEELSIEDKNEVIKSLTKLLRKEIIERGHPEYLQEVIELVTGESGLLETEMPIFIDANSNKFEALMQAIIATRLISHKLPGNGHISASSEGFRRNRTLDTLSSRDRQGIVWVDPSHQGELKSTALKDGAIIESEILIRPHYRITTKDKDGTLKTKMIDLTTDDYSEPILNSEGLIVGRKLNLDMLDPELISQFSFRIPTSSHQSGVIVKVVGFLPPQVGDLLIVPKEHTTQLGEDYDIDKRYIYKSNYIVDDVTGRISKVEYEDFSTEEIVDKFLNAIEEDTLVGISEKTKRDKIKLKMLENAMIDIYKSVYQSTDPSIQQKIFKPLSVKEAKDTANLMNDKIGKIQNPYFTPYSDSYQRKLLKLGADGKGGIGVHSNAVTFEAQLQRLSSGDKVQIQKAIKNKDGDTIYIPSVEKIGAFESSGILGKNLATIDGFRNVTDVHGENQNSSTDNINEQIMGKRNENSYTMSVFALMTHRGFDMTEEFVVNGKKRRLQLTSLFMNQPILRDYTKLRQKYDSMTAQYNRDVEEKIVQELFQKYHATPEATSYSSIENLLPREEYEKLSSHMTGANLWDSLNGIDVFTNMQVAVLQKFLRFKSEADDIREFQQLINLSTSKLGVSYFEVLQRISVLNKIAGQERISNASNLIGDFYMAGLSDVEEDKKAKEAGYTKVGYYYWKPTTKEGVMLINSLKAAQDIMGINFPYEERFIKKMIQNIFDNKLEDPNKKSTTNLKWKYEIISEFKDFLNTSNAVSILDGDVNLERNRIFFDKDGNKSLAAFIADLKRIKHPVTKNSLIADISPKVKSGTEPSLLEHITDYNTNFDKLDKYDAFKELLLDNETIIGNLNGVDMTPRKLAQDLATYAYLANNENGAVGFRNFIHLDYFKILGITSNFRDQLRKIKTDSDYADNLSSRFERQYFQHNPNRANILSSSTVTADDIEIPEGITPKAKESLNKIRDTKKGSLNSVLSQLVIFEYSGPQVPYVSIRNTNIKGSDNQFNLYELRGGYYYRIPTLGTFGYNEYNANTFNQTSSLNIGKVEASIATNSYVEAETNKVFGIPEASKMLKLDNGVTSLLQQIYDSPSTSDEYKKLIVDIQDYIKPSVKIVLESPRKSLGAYRPSDDTILIHPDIYKLALGKSRNNFSDANNMVKEIILEEIVHSITVKEFKKYVDTENKETGEFTLKENAPLFATKLKALYDIARESVPFNSEDESTYYSQNVYEFIAGMFIDPQYRTTLDTLNKGFIKRFQEMLKNLLGAIYTATTGRTLSYKDEVFSSVFELLDKSKTSDQGIVIGTNPMQEIIEKDDIELSPEEISERLLNLYEIGGLESARDFESKYRLPEIKKCK